MAYDLLFCGDYAFPIPFVLAMFPDKVWTDDLFENTVIIMPAMVYSNSN